MFEYKVICTDSIEEYERLLNSYANDEFAVISCGVKPDGSWWAVMEYSEDIDSDMCY